MSQLNPILYTGRVWKHHISEHFIINGNGYIIGASKGGTIFLDYNKMLEYLKLDGREWHIAEIYLNNDPIRYDLGNGYMATILTTKPSIDGFKQLIFFK